VSFQEKMSKNKLPGHTFRYILNHGEKLNDHQTSNDSREFDEIDDLRQL